MAGLSPTLSLIPIKYRSAVFATIPGVVKHHTYYCNKCMVQIGVQGSSANRGLVRLSQQPETIAMLMLNESCISGPSWTEWILLWEWEESYDLQE